MNIVLLGAPGCGKGTQAPLIAERYNIPHISTGAIFRNAVAEQTKLGVLAKQYMDRGELVPDEVTIGLVKERLGKEDCLNGYILDGFPRTLFQAQELEKFQKIDNCIYFDMDTNELINRITGRRVCDKCGATYHIASYASATCDKCGGSLIQRADDTVETLTKRLAVYNAQTEPLVEYYKSKSVLKTINANQTVENVTEQINGCLGVNND